MGAKYATGIMAAFMATCVPYLSVGQKVVQLEPAIGLQWGQGRVKSPSPSLNSSPMNIFSCGLQIRYSPRETSWYDIAAGMSLGGAVIGYNANIPKDKLLGGTVGFKSGIGESDDVWHYAVKASLKSRNLYLKKDNANAPYFKAAFVFGPQLDYMPWQNEGKFGLDFSNSANSITFRKTKLDSTQWGASLYSAVQLRYCRKGHERIVLSLFGILGLRDMRTARLDYSLNSESYSTTICARTSAVGLSLGVPITVYPLLPRKPRLVEE